MKLKFNIYRLSLMKLLYKFIYLYIKNTYHVLYRRQHRSKLLDFATIYPSGIMIGI